MLGAIIGDIAGSLYEFNSTNDYDFEMFSDSASFTDDTICTVAVADAILNGKDYGQLLHSWCRRYECPVGGYGSHFQQWIQSDHPEPYQSYGNGSAMRVSPVGWAFSDWVDVLSEAERSAACTHNHPEGVKGAQATSLAILCGVNMRDCGIEPTKENVKKYVLDEVLKVADYNIDIDIKDVQNRFDVTCQGTVPVALWIIGQSNGFEDAVRKAVAVGADADTLAAITGSIAEAIWGIPDWMKIKAMEYLPVEMKIVINNFYEQYINTHFE